MRSSSGTRVNRDTLLEARERRPLRELAGCTLAEKEKGKRHERESQLYLRRRGNLPKVHVRRIRTATSNYSGMLLMLRARAPRSFALRLLVPSAWFPLPPLLPLLLSTTVRARGE